MDQNKPLTLEEKDKRFAWLKSQQKLHERQPQNKWHVQQARWFRVRAKNVFKFSDIVSRTLKKRSHELA